jgi:RNA polymerase sigma factor (sigma-70 family)
MTALPDWGGAGPSDTELAGAAAAGDRGAFAGIYDRYADRLHDFCIGMLRDRDAAADCVQDVFCTAATRLPQLREPDKLRPWLYAIARNEALRQIRERRREEPSEEVPDMVSGDPGPDTLAARSELADLIAEAAGGLSDRDRSVLELAYRHGLDGPELAEALGVSAVAARTVTHRLRETIERSLGALLVARRARNNPHGCPDLAVILAGWDGAFTILMRKRIARHIESCPVCEEDRRQLVNPAALLAGAPVLIPAPAWLRAHTLSHIQLVAATSALPGTDSAAGSGHTGPDHPQPHPASSPAPHGGFRTPTASIVAAGLAAAELADNHVATHVGVGDGDGVDLNDNPDAPGRGARRLMLLVAVCAAILITALGLATTWLYRTTTSITPTGLTSTTPAAAPQVSPNSPPPASSSAATTSPPSPVEPIAPPPSDTSPSTIPVTPSHPRPTAKATPSSGSTTLPVTTTPRSVVQTTVAPPTTVSPTQHHHPPTGGTGARGAP